MSEMKIKVSFLDRNDVLIAGLSFVPDTAVYMEKTKNYLDWDMIELLVSRGIPYQDKYAFGSSILIEQA